MHMLCLITFKVRSENGYGKWQFWSEIGSGFGDGRHNPTKNSKEYPPPGGFNHFIDILPTNAFREFDWNGQGQILASIGVCLFARKFYDICNLRLLVQFLGCIGIMAFPSSWFISLHPSMEKPDRNYSISYHCFWRKKVDTNPLALLFSWSTIKWQMIR